MKLSHYRLTRLVADRPIFQTEVRAWLALNKANGCEGNEVSEAPCSVCGQLVHVSLLVFSYRTGSEDYPEFAHLECLAN